MSYTVSQILLNTEERRPVALLGKPLILTFSQKKGELLYTEHVKSNMTQLHRNKTIQQQA